jgi:hypothetical protein
MHVADTYNLSGLRPGTHGHVESWFVKLNPPGGEKRALFLKFTLVRPLPGGGEGHGAVWAVWSVHGKPDATVAAKRVFPLSQVLLDATTFRVVMGDCEFASGRAVGRVEGPGGSIAFDLTWPVDGPSWRLLPYNVAYDPAVPLNKVSSPAWTRLVDGGVTVNNTHVVIQGAPGMQGHNWGRRHPPAWAWAHGNGFQGHGTDTVVEAVALRPRVAGVGIPLVAARVRAPGVDMTFNDLVSYAPTRCEWQPGRWWEFILRSPSHRLEARFHAPVTAYAGLRYPNPDGVDRLCLNTNLADAYVELRRGHGPLGKTLLRLESHAAAALEMGTSQGLNGVRPLL